VPIVGPGLEDKGGELCGGREELRKRVGMNYLNLYSTISSI
jgi:hypothetical protein